MKRQLVIGPTPGDVYRGKQLDGSWLSNSRQSWDKLEQSAYDFLAIDLAGLQFIPLFELTMLSARLADAIDRFAFAETQILLDSEGNRDHGVESFLEGVGFRLAMGDDRVRVISGSQRSTTRSPISPLLGLTRISDPSDSRQFLTRDAATIVNWRAGISARFADSPVLASNEVWRLLCHELSANILEHSETRNGVVPGFLSVHVVDPKERSGEIKSWVKSRFPDSVIARSGTGAILELCVADAGIGVLGTLQEAYEEFYDSAGEISDVLNHAFHPLGSRKTTAESWVCGRHALAKVLDLVRRHQGYLTARSDGVEISFDATDQDLERLPDGMGFAASSVRDGIQGWPGLAIRIILPLQPVRAHPVVASSLYRAYESSFAPEPLHPTGHSVPMRDVLYSGRPPNIGAIEAQELRLQLEQLALDLVDRTGALEGVVLDMTDLDWSANEFSAALIALQNVLRDRPVLLSGLNPDLLIEARSEWLRRGGLRQVSSGRIEELFPDFLMNEPLLAQDTEGGCGWLGGPDERTLEALDWLVAEPQAIESILDRFPLVSKPRIQAVLRTQNPQIQEVSEGVFGPVWTKKHRQIELARSVVHHFDQVASRSGAWRIGTGERFRLGWLPWGEGWRDRFLETSRILSRERYGDEIAQRMIARMHQVMSGDDKGFRISDVRVLAVRTAPSAMLAALLHKWWPPSLERPAIVDLGYYLQLGKASRPPRLLDGRGRVALVVQDVLDRGETSRRLVQWLEGHGVPVAGILVLARMTDEKKSRPAPTAGVWSRKTAAAERIEALVEIPRPQPIAPPMAHEDQEKCYWVEPHSLRPFRIVALRGSYRRGPVRQRAEAKIGFLKRLDQDGRIMRTGHFVFGKRHFLLSHPLSSTIRAGLAQDFVHEAASIATGKVNENEGFEGAATSVLMPLHSLIYAVWPEIRSRIRRSSEGKRLHTFFLPATLFVGGGGNLALPLQLVTQVQHAVSESVANTGTPGLRILIIDDALVTGRTASTILGALDRVVQKQMEVHSEKSGESLRELRRRCVPIEWIQMMVFFGQAGNAERGRWSGMNVTGRWGTKFRLVETIPDFGVPQYDERSCPICLESQRLESLRKLAIKRGQSAIAAWAQQRIDDSLPQAVETIRPASRRSTLPSPIRCVEDEFQYDQRLSQPKFDSVECAIWRFYDLVHHTCPVSNILVLLGEVSPGGPAVDEESLEQFARYRWAVLEWCCRHWSRVRADGAQELFVQSLVREVKYGSPILRQLAETVDSLMPPWVVRSLFEALVERLVEIESSPLTTEASSSVVLALEESARIILLRSINGSLDAIPTVSESAGEDLAGSGHSSHGRPLRSLASYLEDAAKRVGLNHGLVRMLARMVTEPTETNLQWALLVIAGHLFRNIRVGHAAVHGMHNILPKLLLAVKRNPTDRLAGSKLIGALREFDVALGHFYVESESQLDFMSLRAAIRRILRTRLNPQAAFSLTDLLEVTRQVGPSGAFHRRFRDTYHRECKGLHEECVRRLKEISEYRDSRFPQLQGATKSLEDRLLITWTVSDEVGERKLLTHYTALAEAVVDFGIDPIREYSLSEDRDFETEICIETGKSDPAMLRIEIITDFATAEVTNDRRRGRRSEVHMRYLRLYGIETSGEAKDAGDRRAKLTFDVPLGYDDVGGRP